MTTSSRLRTKLTPTGSVRPTNLAHPHAHGAARNTRACGSIGTPATGRRHNPDVTPRLSTSAWDLIRRQRHVVAYWQLRSSGVPGTTIRRACSGSRGWLRMTRHAYLTLPIEPQACHRRAAACLGSGSHAVLAGTSALIEAGRDRRCQRVWRRRGSRGRHRAPRIHASRRVVPPWDKGSFHRHRRLLPWDDPAHASP